MKKGLTLVEVAIGLVIIGILAGIAMKALPLIETARIKAEMYKIRKIRTAYATFFTKHNRLPGENPNPDPTKPTYSVPPYGSAQAYNELMHDNLLKDSDLKLDLLDGAYWNIIGCSSPEGVETWRDAHAYISKSICIFASPTPPLSDNTGHAGITPTMVYNTRKFVCTIETHLDDRNVRQGIGRLMEGFRPNEDIKDFSDCDKFDGEANKNVRYMIKVF